MNWRCGSLMRPWISVTTGHGHADVQIRQLPSGRTWWLNSSPRMTITRSGISSRAVSMSSPVYSWHLRARNSASSRWR